MICWLWQIKTNHHFSDWCPSLVVGTPTLEVFKKMLDTIDSYTLTWTPALSNGLIGLFQVHYSMSLWFSERSQPGLINECASDGLKCSATCVALGEPQNSSPEHHQKAINSFLCASVSSQKGTLCFSIRRWGWGRNAEWLMTFLSNKIGRLHSSAHRWSGIGPHFETNKWAWHVNLAMIFRICPPPRTIPQPDEDVKEVNS